MGFWIQINFFTLYYSKILEHSCRGISYFIPIPFRIDVIEEFLSSKSTFLVESIYLEEKIFDESRTLGVVTASLGPRTSSANDVVAAGHSGLLRRKKLVCEGLTAPIILL